MAGKPKKFACYVVDSAMAGLIFTEHLLGGGSVNERCYSCSRVQFFGG